jgi:endonuclease V-like protein UPF0215 family
VLVAALADWHEQHGAAVERLEARIVSVAHCVIEAYSVLTRLPEPLRVAPAIASNALCGASVELID